MTKKLTNYDPAAALVDDEETAFFMADAFETGDAAYIAKALGVVARAKEMRAARATPGEIGIGTDTTVGSAQAMTHLQPSLHQMQNVVPAVERGDAAPNKG